MMTETERAKFLEEHNRMQPIREAYFRLVSNPKDWKAPIDAFVPATISLEAVKDAVIHFTATEPEFIMTKGGWLVKAAGYRMGPAGP